LENTNIILDKIVLHNYKGFYTGDIEESHGIEINFDRHLTIFIGNNGSGKSSVLDAVALCLLKLRKEITEGKYPFPLPSKDTENEAVNNKVNEALIDVFFELIGHTKIIDTEVQEDKDGNHIPVEIERVPKVGFSIYMEKNKSPSEINVSKWFKHTDFEKEYETKEDDERTLELFLAEKVIDPHVFNELSNVPVLVYYGANSINMNLLDKMETVKYSIFHTYENALDSSKFSFDQFFAWFDNQQKRFAQGKMENRTIDTSQIKHISHAITRVLDDEVTEYKNLKIDWFKTPIKMEVTKCNKKTKEEEPLSISQLSSGERSLIALVVDITRRLCLANPKSDNPLEGNGIVLIDEIDVHLHPSWQRKIVPKLRELFPNLQLVVTTHSPQVLGVLDKKHLRIIENKNIKKISPHIKGRDANSIYEEVFSLSARLDVYTEKLKSFYTVLEKNTEDARIILDELIEDWGEHDTEIMRAESYFELY
jgi:predicted ATP-binding protein involved in virulence